MILGIIAAMEEELKPLLNGLIENGRVKKAHMEFISGKLWSKDVVLVVSGIGKVNAAVCTQILIDDFKVDKIINIGVAGGIGTNIYPGDIVIGENLVQHDMDTSVFGDKIGQIPRLDTYDFKCDDKLVSLAVEACKKITDHKYFLGRIVTGDQFIADVNKILLFKDNFGASACEMEGGSIAQVCYLNNIPFIVIRSISDNAGIDAHMDYNKFKEIAVNNSTIILRNMLKIM